MGMRYNPPPNWPRPPAGWTPPPGWRPDPTWGAPPPGWRLWVEEQRPYGDPVVPTSSSAGHGMVALAAATCGWAGFVPPLWAARQRPRDAAFRRKMYAASAGLFTLMVVGTFLVAVSGEDESGSPTGFLSDVGGTLLVVNLIVSVTVAALVRNTRPEAELPGVAQELARRRLREEYRQLARNDPSLARSLGVGRPDLPRNLDDGGLVDLNAIAADQLARHTGLTADEARRVVAVREQAGPFISVDEVAIYADLPHPTVDMLRERAIFLS